MQTCRGLQCLLQALTHNSRLTCTDLLHCLEALHSAIA